MRFNNLFPQDSYRVLKASFLKGLNQVLGLLREFLIILLLEKESLIIYFSVKAIVEIPAIILSQNSVFSIPKKDRFNSYINSFINYPDFILLIFAVFYVLIVYALGLIKTQDISFLLFSIASIFAALLNISFSKLIGLFGIIRGAIFPLVLSCLTCTLFCVLYLLDIKELNAVLFVRILAQGMILFILIFKFIKLINFSHKYYPNISDMFQVNLFVIFIAISRYTIKYMAVDVAVVFNYLLFFISPILLLLINTSFQDNIVRNEKMNISKKKKLTIVGSIYILAIFAVLIAKLSLINSIWLICYVSLLLVGIVYGIKRLEKWSTLRF